MFIYVFFNLCCFLVFFKCFFVVFLVIQCQVMQMLLLRILFSQKQSRGTEIQCNLGVIDNEVNY